MRRFQALFNKPLCLLPASLAAFFQVACAFLFAAMCDLGLDSEPLWFLPAVGAVGSSVAVCLFATYLAKKEDGYSVGRITIPSSYWFLYSLMIGCLLCFALFAPLSLTQAKVFTQTSFVTVAFPTLLAVLDGFAFFTARQVIRRINNGLR